MRAALPQPKCLTALIATALALALSPASAQQPPAQRTPRIAYLFPAGAQPGQTVTLKLAGQFLDGVSGIEVTGGDLEARLIEHQKPLTGRELNLFRDRVRDLQAALRAAGFTADTVTVRSETDTNRVETLTRAAAEKELAELRHKLANPKNRMRENPQLAEDVWLEVRVPTNAAPGERQLRLRTALGLSNPLVFHVSHWPEVLEKEPNDKSTNATPAARLPAVLNGQIQPGDADRFRLRLTRGTRLVAVAQARDLVPYLADAVPGWFQAVLALYDSAGRELAYADDYTFHPDPVLLCEIPRDGEYVLEIRDALYRGREDFVYRIVVGQLPWVTAAFPLGARAGRETLVELDGWNLPTNRLVLAPAGDSGREVLIGQLAGTPLIKPLRFAVSDLPEAVEREPNDAPDTAQPVELPLILNGVVRQPGDRECVRFQGRAGQRIVAEVLARRLDSPLDAALRFRDATGRVLAANDDAEDKAAGLLPHQADARLEITLPADGEYTLELFDAQQHGGPAHAWRLRLSEPQPDFALRVTPSALNVRPGGTATLRLHAIRYDGLTNDITVVLRDAPPGFRLDAPPITGTNTTVKATLSVPFRLPETPVRLELEGRAVVAGRALLRPVIPADEQMQAFFYQHLVPADELLVTLGARGRFAGSRRP
ncbi:MAG: hypothetical protein N3I86_03415 [Verrucomicrobiae bacterium]|nr:hypothetical protein [Verrucomicrobiae bacterium]